MGSVYPKRDDARPWLKASEVEDFLGQTKVWRNKEGKEIPITELAAPYAMNIMWFLERRAPDLAAMIESLDALAAAEMDDAPFAPLLLIPDPVDWMRKTELYRAIAQQAYRARAH